MVTNIDRAATVSRHVEIESVTLTQASFESNVNPLAASEELEAEISYKAAYEQKPGHIFVHVDFRIEAEPKAEGPDAPAVAQLQAMFTLVYSVPADIEFAEDALQFFAELNGTYNAWPYWRELVHTVSGRAGVAALVVPVFRPPVREVDDNSESYGKGSRSND